MVAVYKINIKIIVHSDGMMSSSVNFWSSVFLFLFDQSFVPTLDESLLLLSLSFYIRLCFEIYFTNKCCNISFK